MFFIPRRDLENAVLIQKQHAYGFECTAIIWKIIWKNAVKLVSLCNDMQNVIQIMNYNIAVANLCPLIEN